MSCRQRGRLREVIRGIDARRVRRDFDATLMSTRWRYIHRDGSRCAATRRPTSVTTRADRFVRERFAQSISTSGSCLRTSASAVRSAVLAARPRVMRPHGAASGCGCGPWSPPAAPLRARCVTSPVSNVKQSPRCSLHYSRSRSPSAAASTGAAVLDRTITARCRSRSRTILLVNPPVSPFLKTAVVPPPALTCQP